MRSRGWPAAARGCILPTTTGWILSSWARHFGRRPSRRGASAAWGERVWRIAQAGETVEVETTRGTHRADFAVLAAGAWTGGLGCPTWCPSRAAPGAGPTSAFCRCSAAPPSEDRRTPLHSRQRRNDRRSDGGGGRLSVGDDVVRPLQQFTSEVHSALGKCLPLSRQQAGLRPKPRGGRPLIGPLTEASCVFVASGHYQKRRLARPNYWPNRRPLDRRGNPRARHEPLRARALNSPPLNTVEVKHAIAKRRPTRRVKFSYLHPGGPFSRGANRLRGPRQEHQLLDGEQLLGRRPVPGDRHRRHQLDPPH